MRDLCIGVLMACCACAAQAPARAPSAVSFPADGRVSRLQVRDNTVSYCDDRGPWAGDLLTGRRLEGTLPCQTASESNTACAGVGTDVQVRSPQGEPNDIVDVGAQSYPMDGRVHDCAAEGRMLVVGTGSNVTLIDAARNATVQISKQGSDRVALGAGWVAWVDGQSVRAQRAPVK
jgi:hypothetical protein